MRLALTTFLHKGHVSMQLNAWLYSLLQCGHSAGPEVQVFALSALLAVPRTAQRGSHRTDLSYGSIRAFLGTL